MYAPYSLSLSDVRDCRGSLRTPSPASSSLAPYTLLHSKERGGEREGGREGERDGRTEKEGDDREKDRETTTVRGSGRSAALLSSPHSLSPLFSSLPLPLPPSLPPSLSLSLPPPPFPPPPPCTHPHMSNPGAEGQGSAIRRCANGGNEERKTEREGRGRNGWMEGGRPGRGRVDGWQPYQAGERS